MRPNPQFPADLVTFTEEILNKNLQFLCSVHDIGKPHSCKHYFSSRLASAYSREASLYDLFRLIQMLDMSITVCLILVSDSIQFEGKSYVTVTLPLNLQTTTSNKVILRFKTHQSNGLLLASRSGNDHLMMELRENTICLSVNLGGGR